MIIVVVYKVRNPRTGVVQEIASHGFDPDTGKTVVLQNVEPRQLGAVFDHELQEYVLR